MLYVFGPAGVPDEHDSVIATPTHNPTKPPTLSPVRSSSRQRRNASSGSVQVVSATNKPITAPTDGAIHTANLPISQAFSMS